MAPRTKSIEMAPKITTIEMAPRISNGEMAPRNTKNVTESKKCIKYRNGNYDNH